MINVAFLPQVMFEFLCITSVNVQTCQWAVYVWPYGCDTCVRCMAVHSPGHVNHRQLVMLTILSVVADHVNWQQSYCHKQYLTRVKLTLAIEVVKVFCILDLMKIVFSLVPFTHLQENTYHTLCDGAYLQNAV